MPVRLSLRVIKTTIPIVLGYPFLARTQPTIDLKQRVLRIERKGKVFEIRAFPRGMGSSTVDVNRGQWTRKSPAAR